MGVYLGGIGGLGSTREVGFGWGSIREGCWEGVYQDGVVGVGILR